MSQLIMNWKNNGKEVSFPSAPSGCAIVRFTELEGAVDKWLDIVQYGLSNGRMDEKYYHDVMTSRENYREDKCFFILENGEAVATVAILCNYEKKLGYIHMVACKEAFRGKGYGTLLNRICEYTLKSEGMESAHLTTDDWRIPAIKSYLRAGFEPVTKGEDFPERWEKIFEIIKEK